MTSRAGKQLGSGASQTVSFCRLLLLCRSLPLDALLTVVGAALLERSLVFFHPNPAQLSGGGGDAQGGSHVAWLRHVLLSVARAAHAGCVLGVLPMLRPFTWQCLTLPTLPSGDQGLGFRLVPY